MKYITEDLTADCNSTKPTTLNVEICIIKSEIPSVLTKTRLLAEDGKSIISESNTRYKSGSVIKGHATNITLSNMQALATLLDTANHDTALIASHHTGMTNTIGIMSRGYYEKQGKPAGYITRTKENFTRQAGKQGLLILDCDDKRISKEQFLTAIKSVIPNLDDIAHVYTTSSSSYLYNADTLIQGDKGKRLYIAVNDSSDITRAGQALFDRLWLKGHGYYEIGKAGQYLNRGVIDTAMFKDTCRLDFISGSNCKPPLRQARPNAIFNEGRPLDSFNELPELTDTEQQELTARQLTARQALKQQSLTAREEYCISKGLEHLLKKGINKPTPEQLKAEQQNINKALDNDELSGNFIITLADRRQVTVNEILQNPELYDGAETLDPIEPEYNNYHATGKLFLDSKPALHSFAHGGKYYKLVKQARFIKHTKGQTALTTQLTLQALQDMDSYYDMSKQLVMISNGKVIALNEHLLSFKIGADIQYYIEKRDKDGIVKQHYIDPPIQVIRQILSMNGQRGLKQLKALITAPTITPANHVIYKQGYDEQTQLYLSLDGVIDTPAGKPNPKQVKEAYELIMSVIDTFKLNTHLDRSIILAGFLTAIIRPTLDKAPILALDAPTQGSGKTYLAQCIGTLAIGQPPAITPAIQGNEAEIQKTLLAMLINNERVIIWDNLLGAFNSATIASFVTAESYNGRVLGASEQITLPNKAMLIFTGNNLNLYGDLPRRCITARIDTGEENPLNTKRDLSKLNNVKPDRFILNNRNEIALACITLIRDYLISDKSYTDDSIASFELWDKMTRQVILHLKHTGIDSDLTDIKQSIDANMSNDYEKERLEMLIHYLYTLFKSAPFTAKDIMNVAFDFTGQPAKNPISADLAELLTDMSSNKKPPNALSTGRVLANRLDRIANGMKIIAEQTSGKHAKRYRIVEA